MNSKNALLLLVLLTLLFSINVSAQPEEGILPGIGISITTPDSPQEVAASVQLLVIFTVLSLIPSFLIMLTSFTRIVIVLSFVRRALTLQQIPPNQIVIGLALILTFFVMAPVFTEINTVAITPYLEGELPQSEALSLAEKPLKHFMLRYTEHKDLALFVNLSSNTTPDTIDDISLITIVPAFILSELKKAFIMGFILFVPFMVIDMVVASILMSMGMMMLPPVMISLPFKLLLFVLIDGWDLIIKQLLLSF